MAAWCDRRVTGVWPPRDRRVAQVYRGELHDGRQVAIKVQRPGCEATIALDLHILRSYSQTLKGLISLLGRQVRRPRGGRVARGGCTAVTWLVAFAFAWWPRGGT